uniref:hypothetical protein n=1 Tax=Bacillus sp. DX2.2 TaxID=3073452 RepID=UPI00402ABB2E
MGNVQVKVSDKEGLVQESTGDFVLAINVQEEQSQAIVQGEFNAENYINLVQSTVKALVNVGHSNHAGLNYSRIFSLSGKRYIA